MNHVPTIWQFCNTLILRYLSVIGTGTCWECWSFFILLWEKRIYPAIDMKHNAIFALLLAALALAACGSSGHEEKSPVVTEQAREQNSRLEVALSAGDINNVAQVADSMSLFVDDFTPEQTVQVLMAFLSVHNDAVEHHQSRRDLETIRKYIDVYDIALSVNPKDTRAAFDKARKMNPAVDFDSIARTFREKLTQYDAIHDSSMLTDSQEAAPADTAAPAEEIPLELRPAE